MSRVQMTAIALLLSVLVPVSAAQAATKTTASKPAATKKKAKPKPKPATVTVSLGRLSRGRLLDPAYGPRIRVRTTAKTTVTLTWANGFAKGTTVRFRDKGSKILDLPLLDPGTAALQVCGTRTLTVSITAAWTTVKNGTTVQRSATFSAPVSWSGALCATPTPNCDPLGGAARHCLLPFPNDYFTRPDPTSPTGRRVALDAGVLPKDTSGAVPDPAVWNGADGFSPNQTVVVRIPGLDTQAAFDRSSIVSLADVSQYARADQPVVAIDAATGARQPIWAELDATAASRGTTALLIHPAVPWTPGHRYLIALRGLYRADGTKIAPNPVFAWYRDNTVPPDAAQAVRDRAPHMNDVLSQLDGAGIPRATLTLAWDFTVASDASLSGGLIAARDQAFATLGDTNLADGTVQGAAPTHTATVTPPSTADSARIAKVVSGTYAVPGGTAPFVCRVPRTSTNGPAVTGTRAVVYGHSLFGTRDEVSSDPITAFAFEQQVVVCATDVPGFDAGTTLPSSLTQIPAFADTVQAGIVRTLLLERLLAAPSGLAADPAFQDGGTPNAAPGRVFYLGNGAGSLVGGAATAVSPDVDRAVLVSPGMGMTDLIQRGRALNAASSGLLGAYPEAIDRQVALGLAQMLFDRSETGGYVQHLTGTPYPNTPAHTVLLQAAFGDAQLSNWTALAEARAAGAQLVTPALADGRWPGVSNPFLGLPAVPSYPASGSALAMFDSGAPAPTLPNVPPPGTADPSGAPLGSTTGRAMAGAFLRSDGAVTQTCGGGPC